MSSVARTPVEQAHVVILNNYVRRHHVLAYKALERRVGKLTILLSTEMEPDRDWEAQWEGLDVRLQKNWTYTTNWRHPSGFEESNFIHFPVDTASQLRKLRPDIVFSYELGVRTLLCSWFRIFNRKVPLVMVGNMSEEIENERGIFRRSLRSVLKRTVDYCTYNGPSCRRYIERLGFPAGRMFHVPYCFDTDVIWPGDKAFSRDGVLRLLYCGAISQRKGIMQFVESLRKCCDELSGRKVRLIICGAGPLQNQVAAKAGESLEIEFRGNCNSRQLREEYRNADICAFPTLADEWGLVPVEALASGVPVLGSRHAQSVEVVCDDGVNGWIFSPNDETDCRSAISRALDSSPDQLAEMSVAARLSVAGITPEKSADGFIDVMQSALSKSRSRSTDYGNTAGSHTAT
ncbi:MAG: glycosyltransferase family 4 protein [Planctomycetota bacterium]